MRTEPIAAMNSVALAIGRFATLDEMLGYALQKVLEVVQTDAGSVYLLDEARIRHFPAAVLPQAIWSAPAGYR